MTTSTIDPPESVPAEIVDVRERSTDRQPRGIIDHARQRLQEHPPSTEDEARVPLADRVRLEPESDGEVGHYHGRDASSTRGT
jgi:hypothetical protein